MNVLVDANILIAVLNKEYPSFPHAARILSLNGGNRFNIFTTPISLAIAFYFSEKKSGRKSAMKKMQLMSENLLIAGNQPEDVKKVFQNSKINDFEDSLQYHAAITNRCQCLVTENVRDFYFSEITVMRPEDFLLTYAVGR